jgi:gluconolactonase
MRLGGDTHTIYAFPVRDDAGLGAPRVYATIEPNVPNGFRVDCRGWVWTNLGSSLQVFSAKGNRLGLIPTPQTCSN